MSIKENTIASTTDRKVTLLQWLKDTNKALENDTLTGVEVRQKGNATFSFVLTFKDGSELESNEFVLAQGESINEATIKNGHLYLSLTNGDELDAGDLKPVTSFAINANQHLIVNYGDGTSQDLGAIFSGNVNIDGNFTANSIVENMSGYAIIKNTPPNNVTYNFLYGGIVKNGNKLTCACALIVNSTSDIVGLTAMSICDFVVPASIASKLYGINIGSTTDCLGASSSVSFYEGSVSFKGAKMVYSKRENTHIRCFCYPTETLKSNTDHLLRFEITFLLSDSLVG